MRKGTTPLVTLSLDMDLAFLKSIYVTMQQGRLLITKEKDDLTFVDDCIQFRLSQEETLRFAAGKNVSVQVRAVTTTDTAVATNIVEVPVEQILLDGVIT